MEENVELEPGRIIWGYLTLKDVENIKNSIVKCGLVKATISHRRIQ